MIGVYFYRKEVFMAIFFTSDLHICHNKDFIYQNRGFNSIEEHNKALVRNWNETVSPEDTVYVMGDMIMGDNRHEALDYIKQLNGTIVMVRGNHDTDSKFKDYLNECPNIDKDSVNNEYVKVLKIGKRCYYLSHYPTIIGDILFENKKQRLPVTVCLHGHTHSKDRFEFIEYGCYNVGLDAHDMRPVSLDEVREDVHNEVQERMKEKLENAQSDESSQE